MHQPPPKRLATAAVASIRLVFAAAVIAGCGDPCEDAVEQLCEKACECEGDASCGTTFGDDASGGLSLGFSSADDCAALFRGGCEEGVEDEIDGEACEAAVPDATCGENGLLVPDACAGG
jgi:hypothetical protein